jgi:pSer/pThr/pTyr-binding forkhead associated (FHA) protein
MGTPISGAIGGAKLVGVSGPFAGQVFGLVPGGEMTIGRQSDRSISLSMDNTVSRQHARIADEGGRFVLYDLGSANGTYVNNSKVTSHVLTNGDLIQIGSTKFRYEG